MTQPWRRCVAAAVLVLSGTACGDDEPTGPIPDVAGTYNGSFIVQFLLQQQGIQGSMQVLVEQAGESVTITGEIQASGNIGRRFPPSPEPWTPPDSSS